MGHPDVTVVVPTHDRPGWLAVTLHTVLAQRGVDLEVVVVDDGSRAPGTAESIASLESERVRVVRNETALGACAARNAGAAVGRGAVLAFCDDDDVWAPTKLRRQLDALDAGDAAWACTGAVDIDATNAVLRGTPPLRPDDIRDHIDRANPVPAGASNVVLRADLFAELGGFDITLKHVGDWDLWRRLVRAAGNPAVVDDPLVAYRQHGRNDNRSITSILREMRAWSRREQVDVAWGDLYLFYSDVAAQNGSTGRALALAVRGALAGSSRRARKRIRRGQRPSAAVTLTPYQQAARAWLVDVPAPADVQGSQRES